MREPELRIVGTGELTELEVATIRALMDVAFGDDEDERFTDEDWEHSLGGVHLVLDIDGLIVSHASVVERELQMDGLPLRTGYVEAVATIPDRERRGYGSQVMRAANRYIRSGFELGALGTGRHEFYERLDWERWLGPSFVRMPDGLRPTPEDDGYIMVLATPSSPSLDLTAAISCDWRRGDVW